MNTESRKIQRMGLSSLGVSLPKDWTIELGLNPGSLVQLSRDEDGSIRIDAPGRKPPEERGCLVRADECKEPRVLERVIIGNYLLGRDTIEIVSSSALSKESMEEIYGAMDKLTGVTIVEQADRSTMLESFVEPTKFPVRGLLRRLQYLAERMIRLSFRGIMKLDEDALSNVTRLEEEVDRLYWLITRQLMVAAQDKVAGSQIGETDPRHIAGDMLVAAMLERVADVALDLIRRSKEAGLELSGFPDEVSRRVFALGATVEGLAKDTMEAFFMDDVTSASHALEVVQDAEKEVQSLSASIPLGADVDSLYCITCLQVKSALNSLAHIADYYGTIAHVALNRALEGESKVCVPRGVPS
ncbi:MAG: phosphate uptake regulator PhoU [Candidatus Thermoplasmatota archaeon]|nr:phosphate uptake regulator PhoU [Candidatus Thermoplasmatota archaeon]